MTEIRFSPLIIKRMLWFNLLNKKNGGRVFLGSELVLELGKVFALSSGEKVKGMTL